MANRTLYVTSEDEQAWEDAKSLSDEGALRACRNWRRKGCGWSWRSGLRSPRPPMRVRRRSGQRSRGSDKTTRARMGASRGCVCTGLYGVWRGASDRSDEGQRNERSSGQERSSREGEPDERRRRTTSGSSQGSRNPKGQNIDVFDESEAVMDTCCASRAALSECHFMKASLVPSPPTRRLEVAIPATTV